MREVSPSSVHLHEKSKPGIQKQKIISTECWFFFFFGPFFWKSDSQDSFRVQSMSLTGDIFIVIPLNSSEPFVAF